MTAWLSTYRMTRALRDNAPLSGDLVALALLLQHRGALTISDVAEALDINTGTASDLASRGIASGLFVSTRQPGDRRMRIVDLSPAAMARLNKGENR